MHEYKDVSPWIGISAYAVAATTATLRVTHRKHYVHDVLAGAAIGILSSEAAYLMLPLWQKLTTKKDKDDKDKGDTAIAIFPSASTEHIALTGAIVF
jgi:membrane-associated phospholipid phosphatase